jgi:cytoskeletal protein RodZ
MFRLNRKPSLLDERTDQLLTDLDRVGCTPQQYEEILSMVERLYKLKAQEAPQRVSPDTMLLVAANLVGIALVIRHEQFNVITSKAMSFAIKPK